MPKQSTKQSFEDSLEELDSIVQTMEEEQLPLEELISKYERGATLHQECESFLKSAKQRLEKIAQSKNTVNTVAPNTESSSSNDDDEIRLF